MSLRAFGPFIPRTCGTTQLFCAFSKSRQRVGEAACVVLPAVVGHCAHWQLIYELLLGEHCGLLNYVVSLWSLLDGHLTVRLHARDLQSTTLLIDSLMNFQSSLDIVACGNALT